MLNRRKAKKIVNKFLLAWYKFLLEMHLKQPGFIYSACRPFTKNKERIQKFKETGYTNYIDKNYLDKACFQHDMAYADFKDLKRKTASDKVLRDKALTLLKILNMMGINEGLLLWFISFLINSPLRFQINLYQVLVLLIMRLKKNLQLAKELHKPIIRKF